MEGFMMNKYYITISRQFGSLGRAIAHELSERLGIEYYDRDIVEEASRKMNLPVSTISKQEEKSLKTSFINMLFPLGNDSEEQQDAIFKVQREIILNKADISSCIIVGRCADYVLKDKKQCLNIFIYAPEEVRFENCVNVLKMPPSTARKMMHDVDYARELYWRRYAKYSLTDFNHRQLMIDSSLLGVHGTAELIADIVQKKFLVTL